MSKLEQITDLARSLDEAGFHPKLFKRCIACRKRACVWEKDNGEYWCIRCHWGELALETQEALGIDQSLKPEKVRL